MTWKNVSEHMFHYKKIFGFNIKYSTGYATHTHTHTRARTQ